MISSSLIQQTIFNEKYNKDIKFASFSKSMTTIQIIQPFKQQNHSISNHKESKLPDRRCARRHEQTRGGDGGIASIGAFGGDHQRCRPRIVNKVLCRVRLLVGMIGAADQRVLRWPEMGFLACGGLSCRKLLDSEFCLLLFFHHFFICYRILVVVRLLLYVRFKRSLSEQGRSGSFFCKQS